MNPPFDEHPREGRLEYPEKPCVDHPSRMWEWDGYEWVCPGCVLKHPKERGL